MLTPTRCQCGKLCYPSEGAARQGLRECQAKGRCEQRYYPCFAGIPKGTSAPNGWHLTSQPLIKAA